jgi:uncharacterized protein (TIGR03437 family)
VIKTSALVVMFAISAAGQTPTITSVVSGGSYNPEMLASGGLGTILGSGLSGSTYSASGLPWPTTLGNTTVQVCYDGESCVPAHLTYVAADQINFQLPAGLTVGAFGPNFPCNVTYKWEIGVQVTQTAQLSYQQTFYTSIPVVVYPGDLPCS